MSSLPASIKRIGSKTSSPKGNDRSLEPNVPRSNLISKNIQMGHGNQGPKSNSFELLCLSLRAANSVVSGPIWPKFELFRDFMHVLVTCMYKKDRIKNNREKVETSFSPL